MVCRNETDGGKQPINGAMSKMVTNTSFGTGAVAKRENGDCRNLRVQRTDRSCDNAKETATTGNAERCRYFSFIQMHHPYISEEIGYKVINLPFNATDAVDKVVSITILIDHLSLWWLTIWPV